MKKTRIEWCDSTWNPVTGCLHGCPYCYARSIAHRFAGTKIYPNGFEPMFWADRLGVPDQWKEPRNIFVCSMADLFGEWVPDEWIKEVFAACDKAPWHTYLFLTKNPNRYLELAKKDLLPRQHWYGYSATRQNQLWHFHHADDCPCLNLFISMEPLLEDISHNFSTHMPADWVILGAETGNRKDKVVPKKNWIQGIVNSCEWSDIPVFMKDSLIPIVGEENMRREVPYSIRRHSANE